MITRVVIASGVKMCGVTQSEHFFTVFLHFMHPFGTGTVS